MDKEKLNETIREINELSENELVNKARLIELAKALTTYYTWEDKEMVDKDQLEIPFEKE